MQNQYDRERDAQRRIEAQLTGELAVVDVRDVELDERAQTIRVFIAHPDGVSLELCTQVTRAVHDLFPDQALEVSSPGIEPALRSSAHFVAAVGSRVRVRLRAAGQKAFIGELIAAGDDTFTVRRDDGTEQEIALTDVARARIVDTAQPVAAAPASESTGGASQ